MTRESRTRSAGRKYDPAKFENVLQLGGIRTGILDTPGAGGTSGVRVALVDTGAGLRFTVALDRGGDIVDATYQQFGLAYLSPNGLRPPNPAYHQGTEWLRGWAGGLLTTCGPEYIGGPRMEPAGPTSLHGRYSNCPATVTAIRNPDPNRDRWEMELELIVRDTRVFGPAYEIRRTIRCTLGRPEINIEDEVTNCGDTTSPHHWLYHCNLGYPLLDQDTRFVYRGRADYWEVPPPAGQDIVQPLSSAAMNRLKRVPAALPGHSGSGERGLIVSVKPAQDGICHVGVINNRLKLGLHFAYPALAFPRLAHWQHYGPRGSYATAIEPFHGSLLGRARERDGAADSTLAPGERRTYALRILVLSTQRELNGVVEHDGPLEPWG